MDREYCRHLPNCAFAMSESANECTGGTTSERTCREGQAGCGNRKPWDDQVSKHRRKRSRPQHGNISNADHRFGGWRGIFFYGNDGGCHQPDNNKRCQKCNQLAKYITCCNNQIQCAGCESHGTGGVEKQPRKQAGDAYRQNPDRKTGHNSFFLHCENSSRCIIIYEKERCNEILKMR